MTCVVPAPHPEGRMSSRRVRCDPSPDEIATPNHQAAVPLDNHERKKEENSSRRWIIDVAGSWIKNGAPGRR